jgi:integrase
VRNIPEIQRQSHFVFFAFGGPAELLPRKQLVRERQPFIFCPNEAIHTDASLFLADTTTFRSSAATWRTYAYSLVTWLDFLELSVDRDYCEADQDDLLEYRNFYSRLVSPYTNEHYSRKTIAFRMTVAISFCQWLGGRGSYRGDILAGKLVRRIAKPPSMDHDMLAHTRSGNVKPGGYAIIPKRRGEKPIRPLTPNELKLLIAAAGIKGSRDRLVIDIGWATGLRVEEIAKLDVMSFEALLTSGKPFSLKWVSVLGKGSKERMVAFPNWLIRDIQVYIDGERKIVTAQRRAASDPNNTLLVTHLDSRNPPAGSPLSIRTIQSVVNHISISAGLILPGFRWKDSKSFSAARVSPHDLRHTYSVMALAAFCVLGDEKGGLIHIQRQLGHAFRATTENVYLAEASIWMTASGIRPIGVADLFESQS